MIPHPAPEGAPVATHFVHTDDGFQHYDTSKGPLASFRKQSVHGCRSYSDILFVRYRSLLHTPPAQESYGLVQTSTGEGTPPVVGAFRKQSPICPESDLMYK